MYILYIVGILLGVLKSENVSQFFFASDQIYLGYRSIFEAGILEEKEGRGYCGADDHEDALYREITKIILYNVYIKVILVCHLDKPQGQTQPYRLILQYIVQDFFQFRARRGPKRSAEENRKLFHIVVCKIRPALDRSRMMQFFHVATNCTNFKLIKFQILSQNGIRR